MMFRYQNISGVYKYEIFTTIQYYPVYLFPRGDAARHDPTSNPRKRLWAGSHAFSALYRNPSIETRQGNCWFSNRNHASHVYPRCRGIAGLMVCTTANLDTCHLNHDFDNGHRHGCNRTHDTVYDPKSAEKGKGAAEK